MSAPFSRHQRSYTSDKVDQRINSCGIEIILHRSSAWISLLCLAAFVSCRNSETSTPFKTFVDFKFNYLEGEGTEGGAA